MLAIARFLAPVLTNSQPDTQLLDAFDASYSGNQIRAEKSAVGRFVCKATHCSKAEIMPAPYIVDRPRYQTGIVRARDSPEAPRP